MRLASGTCFFALMFSGLATPSWAQVPRLADDQVAAWVQRRVADWQPMADDRRFDEIGWVEGIRAAGKLSVQHERPVFLFTHDGHIAVGRC